MHFSFHSHLHSTQNEMKPLLLPLLLILGNIITSVSAMNQSSREDQKNPHCFYVPLPETSLLSLEGGVCRREDDSHYPPNVPRIKIAKNICRNEGSRNFFICEYCLEETCKDQCIRCHYREVSKKISALEIRAKKNTPPREENNGISMLFKSKWLNPPSKLEAEGIENAAIHTQKHSVPPSQSSSIARQSPKNQIPAKTFSANIPTKKLE